MNQSNVISEVYLTFIVADLFNKSYVVQPTIYLERPVSTDPYVEVVAYPDAFTARMLILSQLGTAVLITVSKHYSEAA